ncbi:MAG TPA: SRPBCC domain-containing protein [Caulobacteraceae bacterium]|jgi:uncharacterized protein YndB with AHSA1/START domain
MKTAILALAAALSASAAIAEPPTKSTDVVDTSFVTPDGQSDLQQSVVINAPVAVLWKSFVDPKEFARWNAPVAAIDMRVGGTLEATYNPKQPIGNPNNIKHRVITFLPERLIVFQNIQAPKELRNPDKFQRTVIIVQFEPRGPAKTKVTLSCTGFGADAASQQIYRFFQVDNAEELERWKKVYEAPAG